MRQECDDCTDRYWLLQKHKGQVFLDEDVDPPEYLKIVDLEWNVKKPRAGKWLAWRRARSPGANGR